MEQVQAAAHASYCGPTADADGASDSGSALSSASSGYSSASDMANAVLGAKPKGRPGRKRIGCASP
jgi:hypothetical protein